MIHAELASLLKQAIGLDASSIGTSAIERAVQMRVSACKLDDAHSYWEFLRTSATELQELTEALIVPETWFFRDCKAFEALARIAHQEWLRTHPEGTLRLLSVPCSSGEEPCSMAMALLDGGFPPSRYRIDAVDISAQMLMRARRAIYRNNSFRSVELTFRDRYFEKTAHGYRLNDTVRQQVHYRHGNLFAADFLPGAAIYDIIFCRNLLIYFDRPTQDRAVQVLQRLLTPEGVLFVGPSETALLLSHDFVSIKVPMAFALRKGGTVARAVVAASTHSIQQSSSTARESAVAKPAEPAAAQQRSGQAKPAASVDSGIDDASRLADEGRLVEAAQSCEKYLREHGPSVQALHLIGLIRAAAGDLPAAAQYYRKALYLDPNHHDTLLHLGLLLEKQGDATGARVVRDRVLRLEKPSGAI